MVASGSTSTYHEKRLERATRHVSDYWLPVNPNQLIKVSNGLRDGLYEGDISLLINDLKGDYALFTSCLRSLVEMMKEEDSPLPASSRPSELLEQGGLERLKTIIALEEKRTTPHQLDGGNDLQLARFQEALLSASTAEVLAQDSDISADDAFASALLRQLGYALIVWNYPGLYQECFLALGEDASLDIMLTRKLGFSPALLAMRVLHSWGIGPELIEAWGLVDFYEEEDEEGLVRSATGATLAELCQIGEALARANSPVNYPSAREDWEFARYAIEERIGSEGLEAIHSRFHEHCDHYITYLPHIFKPAPLFDTSKFRAFEELDPEFAKNPLIVACEPELGRLLRRLYQAIDNNADTKANLRYLVDEVIPNSGFQSGCIYSIDPGLMVLLPQLQIGQSELREFKPVDYSLVSSNSDIIAVGYQSSDPVVGYGDSKAGSPVSVVVGVFGGTRRAGVLYLEKPGIISSNFNEGDLLHYRALRQALNHCLGL